MLMHLLRYGVGLEALSDLHPWVLAELVVLKRMAPQLGRRLYPLVTPKYL